MPRTMKSKSYNKCFEKRREHGCSRVHKIKLTKVFPTSPYRKINNNSHTTNCNSCDDSDNCMKLLSERLVRIENLVNNLYKLTQGELVNSKKYPSKQNRTIYNIDLTSCKLEDLQRLVNFTTNAMSLPSSSQPSLSPKSIHQENIHSENYSRTRNFNKQEEILKYDSQDSGYISDDVDLPSPVTSSKGNIDTLECENHIHAA
ncbi:12051_t:CDS:2 [Funneliformis geosporum]|uniref:13077_t:CDS:1 n=1 Tax=Funneliformis geosporum TaxID=1117311 RepID=A0A9W4WKY2_9GLOM|nr:12051_t:CDS:2 [Funneliformis geosporum]CAI2169712.1 13077_t:CDS:2 [Funneliformis geosporum]